MYGSDELDEDAKALLAPFLDQNPGGDEAEQDDPFVLNAPKSADDLQSETPSRAQYEELQAQLRAQQEQIGRMAAQQLPPTPATQQQYAPQQQTYQPQGNGYMAQPSVNAGDVEKTLNEQFYANPARTIAAILAANNQSASAPLVQQQIQTQAVLAQNMISNLRQQYASQNPELAKSALPEVDKLVASTSPQKLAELVGSGQLQVEYEKAYFEAVGRKMAVVYQTAAQRRAVPAAAPNLGGGQARASVSDLNEKRASGKPIRMSDLSEADQEAVRQGAKYGVPAEVVLAQTAE